MQHKGWGSTGAGTSGQEGEGVGCGADRSISSISGACVVCPEVLLKPQSYSRVPGSDLQKHSQSQVDSWCGALLTILENQVLAI